MKPVQVLFGDELLAQLDADDEVEKLGRSRVLRQLVTEYLAQRRRDALDAQYATGYGGDVRVHEELDGWDEEGTWPDD
jgi:metal-responsive CopG/Arc/MetJ family transcriptional regulator